MSQNKESKVAVSNDDDDDNDNNDYLKPSEMFSGSFKSVYRVLGLSFTSNRSKSSIILSTVLTLRLTLTMLMVLLEDVHAKRNLVPIINDFAFDLCPLVEFLYLAYRLPRFNRIFELYTHQLNLKTRKNFKASVRRLNHCSVLFILTQLILAISMTLMLFREPRNWMVKRTFPVETPLGPLAENIIGHLSLAYECSLKNYIPLSVCLYLCYYKLLLHIKSEVLSHISFSTSCKYMHKQLKELNSFFDSFEETFSFLPLNWLAYSIGPGLSYALTFSDPSASNEEAARKYVFLFKVLWNFVAVLFILFLISSWQNQVDSVTDALVWEMEINIQSAQHSRLLDRITKIMKRSVTVWQTCPIERMLILSFIGSALTFSVFFLQLAS